MNPTAILRLFLIVPSSGIFAVRQGGIVIECDVEEVDGDDDDDDEGSSARASDAHGGGNRVVAAQGAGKASGTGASDTCEFVATAVSVSDSRSLTPQLPTPTTSRFRNTVPGVASCGAMGVVGSNESGAALATAQPSRRHDPTTRAADNFLCSGSLDTWTNTLASSVVYRAPTLGVKRRRRRSVSKVPISEL